MRYTGEWRPTEYDDQEPCGGDDPGYDEPGWSEVLNRRSRWAYLFPAVLIAALILVAVLA